MKLGLIVNPFAGMGGSVGLKGTDGAETLALAVSLGAIPVAAARTIRSLAIAKTAQAPIAWIAPRGPMGGDCLSALGITAETFEMNEPPSALATIAAATRLVLAGIDILIFSGGDGTARDLASTLPPGIPMLGIPCGVKMHSGIFARTPEAAGRLLVDLSVSASSSLRTQEVEILDVDEDALRRGRLRSQLHGYARAPVFQRTPLQGAKTARSMSDDAMLKALGAQIAEELLPGVTYLVGPGTSAKRPLDALGISGTLLGLDVIRNKSLMLSDASSQAALDLVDDGPLGIIVGVTGGQGSLFGRGNQQIGARAIRRAWPEGVTVIAGRNKLLSLPTPELFVDTGEVELDAKLRGFTQIRTGPQHYMMMRLV